MTEPRVDTGAAPWAAGLRAALQQQEPGAAVDGQVRAAMAAAARRRAGLAPERTRATPDTAARVPRRWAWGWAGGALVALGVLLSPTLGLHGDAGRAVPSVPPLRTDLADLGSGFVPVAAAEQWRALDGGEATTAWLVPTELPRERLGLLGLPYDPARAGETVRAELLMHGSGLVLAVRVAGP